MAEVTAPVYTEEILILAYRMRSDGQSDPVSGDEHDLAEWLRAQIPGLSDHASSEGDPAGVLGWVLTRDK
jgi:hypothetical protein